MDRWIGLFRHRDRLGYGGPGISWSFVLTPESILEEVGLGPVGQMSQKPGTCLNRISVDRESLTKDAGEESNRRPIARALARLF